MTLLAAAQNVTIRDMGKGLMVNGVQVMKHCNDTYVHLSVVLFKRGLIS